MGKNDGLDRRIRTKRSRYCIDRWVLLPIASLAGPSGRKYDTDNGNKSIYPGSYELS
jgi:hypothetical protein